jgi:hypothetical protein
MNWGVNIQPRRLLRGSAAIQKDANVQRITKCGNEPGVAEYLGGRRLHA